MPKSLNLSETELSKEPQKRYYWLGHEGELAQDRFFVEALDDNLWMRGNAEQWDTCWYTGMPDSEVFEQLDTQKTINHIPGNNALTIKSLLYETLMAAKHHALGCHHENRYQFFPDTYSMPEDYYRYQADAAAEPDALWIQKPKNLSRGRGIEVVQHPPTVPFGSDWLVQRYIKEPHLYDGHKYVLRFYVLITSVEPLRFYLYEEGFSKLASETYDDSELDNLYRHLTNPDVNEENDNVDAPVRFFSFARYRQWLKSCGHDDEKLFEEFKDLIALTVIAAREKMRHQLDKKEADTRGCYELIGLDCMVDSNLKPWILECNLSPSLETYASGDVEASDEFTVKRQLVHDLVNMMQLNEPVQDYSPEEKASMEYKNRGGFIPLLTEESANDYLKCFPIPRASDVYSLQNTAVDYDLINTQANEASELIFDDSLAIQSSNEKGDIDFLSPNELAIWIWLKNGEGLTPPQIATTLSESMPLPDGLDNDEFTKNLLKQVWDTLADWGQAGVFDKVLKQDPVQTVAKYEKNTMLCQWGEQVLVINVACSIAANYLKPLLKNALPDSIEPNADVINIYPGQYGYTLVVAGKVVENKIKLAELMPAILNVYFDSISRTMNFTAAVITVKQRTILVVAENLIDHLALIDGLGEDSCLLSSFPALGEAAGVINTGSLPLVRNVKMAKESQSIIAQVAKTTHILEESPTESEVLLLDGVVFIEEQKEQCSMTHITQAQALVLLWTCFFKKDQSTAKALSAWLPSIPFIQYHVLGNAKLVDIVNEINISDKVPHCT